MKRSISAALALAFLAAPAMAADHRVEMLNKGDAGPMVFQPAFVQAEVGDTITFVPTDKSHDVASIKGMLPEGVEEFKSKVNEEYVLTVTEPGLYGLRCSPHTPMGMVALVQVGGDASNYDALAEGKLPKRAREQLDAQLAKVTR